MWAPNWRAPEPAACAEISRRIHLIIEAEMKKLIAKEGADFQTALSTIGGTQREAEEQILKRNGVSRWFHQSFNRAAIKNENCSKPKHLLL